MVAGVDAGRVVPIVRPGASDLRHEAITVTVGRDASMALRLASNAVSSHHCTVTIAVGAEQADSDAAPPTITVTDAGSRNGTVVRGVRIGTEPVAVAPGELVRCGPAVFYVGEIPIPDTPRSVAALLDLSPSGPVAFNRSPVDLPPGPGPEVALPAPPRRPRTGRPGIIGLLLPMALAAVMVIHFKNLMYGLFALMGPVMMLVSTADRASRNRRVRRRSGRRYRTELDDVRGDLRTANEHEQRRRRAMHPDLAELARRADVSGAALWSRRRDHPQFLTLALGLADVPWDPPVAEVPDELDELRTAVEQAGVLHQAPLTVGLLPARRSGLRATGPARRRRPAGSCCRLRCSTARPRSASCSSPAPSARPTGSG